MTKKTPGALAEVGGEHPTRDDSLVGLQDGIFAFLFLKWGSNRADEEVERLRGAPEDLDQNEFFGPHRARSAETQNVVTTSVVNP